MKWFLSVLCWLSAIGIFYGMFFKLAPYIGTLIPAGQWQGLIKVIAYFLVAYFGGIGIPMVLIVWGIFMIPKSW